MYFKGDKMKPEEELQIARKLADMVGSEIVESGFSYRIIKQTAEILMEDYKQVVQLAEEIKS